MGCGRNSGRCFLLAICSLQMASSGLRQVFDFLGFMWLPILATFFHVIFVIFGFFGAYQTKPKYIVTYVVWLVAWLTYNLFVMCFYLNVGALDNSLDLLNFNTGSASWWQVNGPGCVPVYPVDFTGLDLSRPLRPERVDGCLLSYEYVETVQAALQCLLAVLGAGASACLLTAINREDNACQSKTRATSIYSVEYSPNNEDSGDSIDLESPALGTLTSQYNSTNSSFLPPPPAAGDTAGPQASSTLTPRRVKRHHRNRSSSRSRGHQDTRTRGTTPAHPTPETNFANNYTSGSVGSLAGVGARTGRNSHRRSARNNASGRGRNRSQYVNPVTQLMDDSSTSTDCPPGVAGGAVGAVGGVGPSGRLGHSNPMYVHSRPVSLHSLASTAAVPDPVERPPSVHSSYSNYHGVRAAINQANLNQINLRASADDLASSTAPGMLGNLPHGSGGLQFGRALPHQAGKGLRGSQNSILSNSEQRRTALTASEIRVPDTAIPSSTSNFSNVPPTTSIVGPSAGNALTPAGGRGNYAPAATVVHQLSPSISTSESLHNSTVSSGVASPSRLHQQNPLQQQQQNNFLQQQQAPHQQHHQHSHLQQQRQQFQQSQYNQAPHQHHPLQQQQQQPQKYQQQNQMPPTSQYHQNNNHQYYDQTNGPGNTNFNNQKPNTHFNFPVNRIMGSQFPQYSPPTPASPSPSSPPYSTVFGAVPRADEDDEVPPPYVGNI